MLNDGHATEPEKRSRDAIVGAEGDRRQVTILFADLVGYTPLAENHGEETLYRIIRPITERMIACVDRFGGTVQDLTGDGIMAVFGAPQALEDAPLRACRAALAIREAIVSLSGEIEAEHGVTPQVRIGIHTGNVVLGRIDEQGGEALRAVGDTVNIAARFESDADPGGVLMSADTFRLVEGLVEAEFDGEHRLKGRSETVTAYVLTGLRPEVDRFTARALHGLTPWVGRSEQIDRLHDEWRSAEGGSLRMVAVGGEAGIGKSRLLSEFREVVRDSSPVVLRGHCAADGAAIPFLPFIEVVRRSFRIGDAQDADTINTRLAEGLTILGLAESDHEPYLANLLTGTRDNRLAVDGERLGHGTLEALKGCLLARCRMTPTILIVEDLHWIDPQSQSLLSWLADGATEVPLLVICTFRPGYHRPWLDSSRVVHIDLEALATGDVETLLRFRLGAEVLSPEVGAALVDRAGGNPLFAEEIASYVATSGRVQISDGLAVLANSGEANGVPDSLANVLLDRVDHLDQDVRGVLSVASVIGRRFDSDVVGRVAGLNGKLGQCLEVLKDEEIIFAEHRPGTWFRFKHALIEDAVYGRLLGPERNALHKSVASVLEDLHKGAEAEVAEALAYHYGQSGPVVKTIHYLTLAGQKSLDLYAIEPACSRFLEALALAEANPGVLSDTETADLVLSILRMYLLSGDFTNISGMNDKYRRFFDGLDDPLRLALFMHDVGTCHEVDGHPDLAKEELDKCLALAMETDDEKALGYGLMAMAWWVTFWGEPGPAQLDLATAHGEKASKIGRRLKDDFLACFGEYAVAICGVMNGNPRVLRERGNRLLRLADEDGNLMARQTGLVALAWVSILNFDPEDALYKAEEALQLSMTPIVRMQIVGLRGAAMAQSGRGAEAYEVLHPAREALVERNFLSVVSGLEANYGLAIFLKGEFARGIKWIEDREKHFVALGFHPIQSGLSNATLGEIYLNMATSDERPPLSVMLRNAWFLLRTLPSAKRKAREHFERAAEIWRACPAPSLLAWALCGLGELAAADGRSDVARSHCAEAIDLATSVDALATVERAKKILGRIT
jgi:class 3 adenylate cyclase